MKICSRCKENKPSEEFVKHSRNKDGLYCYCKKCHQVLKREKKYNTTEKALQLLAEKQNFSCKICKESPLKLVVDHCHITGKIRGLLCNACNRGLGMFQDDPKILYEAFHYLFKEND